MHPPQPPAPPALRASGFFVLRAPLLPFDDFLAWSAEGEGESGAPRTERLRARLREALSRPEVREAVWIASPELARTIPEWEADPEGRRGRKAEPALVRYFARMASRATPFGLFAGCATGAVDGEPRLELGPRGSYGRHTRLDMGYLAALAERLDTHPPLRDGLRYRANDSVHAVAGGLHYVRPSTAGGTRRYHLVAVERTPYLEATLRRAAGGATLRELAAALAGGEVGEAEAAAYVASLADARLLVPELEPPVTGTEPVEAMAAVLAHAPAGAGAAALLRGVERSLRELDAAGPGRAPEAYREVAARLEALPAPVELARLFQVDMSLSAPDLSLGEEPLRALLEGVELLHAVSPPRTDPLRGFRERFTARYDLAEVPLLEALDEEIGIGFPPPPAEPPAASPRDDHLLRRVVETLARGERELRLDDGDVERLRTAGAPPLPEASAAIASLAAESPEALREGRFQLLLTGVVGPSGAALLGRFCHLDPRLRAGVERHLREEEALRPDAVFAEVVHLPQGRVGNVLFRPVLRAHEIPYLAASSAGGEARIELPELLVSVRGGRTVLRSARLGREVVPRLSTAHAYQNPANLVAYRFLCALQAEGVTPAGWRWGTLEALPFLPRVTRERAVLVRARWRLERSDLEALVRAARDGDGRRVAEWREARGVPRLATFAERDSELPVDFENPLSVRAFAEVVKGERTAMLHELFPGPGELCLRGPDGAYRHEIVVPCIRPRAVAGAEARASRAGRPVAREARSFPPGSRWSYLKLYTGAALADRVLREVVHPAVEAAVGSGAAERWFFIRYADPEPHLRLRFEGDPRDVADALAPLAGELRRLLGERTVWRVQHDTYEREIERYGGVEATRLAERIFHADSDAVLALLRAYPGDAGSEPRRHLVLRGIDRLLADFGLDEEGRRAFYRRLTARGGARRGEWNRRFRAERETIARVLGDEAGAEGWMLEGMRILARRSERIAPLALEIRGLQDAPPADDLLESYAHMHVNRALRLGSRAQEPLFHHHLDRHHDSLAARTRQYPGPSRVPDAGT
jgi:lantibiotic biosynthesis protein